MVALAQGPSAVFYNPASLVLTEGTAVSLNHTELYANINHEFVSLIHNVPGVGSFALNTTALYTDEMKVRTPLEPEGTGEYFRSSNYKVGLSYAWRLTGRVSFGASVNYIHLDYFKDFNANAFSVDISTLYRSRFRDFRVGMLISNFGSNVTVINETYPLPTKFEFGLGINAIERGDMELKVGASAAKPYNGSPKVKMGTEWNYDETFFVRAGYQPYHDSANLTFGSGVALDIGGTKLAVDYSLSRFQLLSMVHRVGLSMNF